MSHVWESAIQRMWQDQHGVNPVTYQTTIVGSLMGLSSAARGFLGTFSCERQAFACRYVLTTTTNTRGCMTSTAPNPVSPRLRFVPWSTPHRATSGLTGAPGRL